MSEAGFTCLKSFEGRCPAPYCDHLGFLTVGFGHLCDTAKSHACKLSCATGAVDTACRPVLASCCAAIKGRTPEQLFAADIEARVSAVSRKLADVRGLTQGQFDAFVSLAFQYGMTGFQRTSAAALKALRAGNATQAGDAYEALIWGPYAPRRRTEHFLFTGGSPMCRITAAGCATKLTCGHAPPPPPKSKPPPPPVKKKPPPPPPSPPTPLRPSRFPANCPEYWYYTDFRYPNDPTGTTYCTNRDLPRCCYSPPNCSYQGCSDGCSGCYTCRYTCCRNCSPSSRYPYIAGCSNCRIIPEGDCTSRGDCDDIPDGCPNCRRMPDGSCTCPRT